MSIRTSAIHDAVSREGRVAEWTKDPNTGRCVAPSKVFNESVFTNAKLKEALPKTVYEKYTRLMNETHTLDKETADQIAHAVRTWAISQVSYELGG